MASEVYSTVCNCRECAVSRAGLNRKRHLKLLPASGALELVAMDILGTLPNATTENQFIVVIKNWYTRLIPAILSPKTTKLHVDLPRSTDHTIRDLRVVLTDNGLQFVAIIFET